MPPVRYSWSARLSWRKSKVVSCGAFVRAFAVWVVIILAETIHGIARVTILEPIAGDLRARQIGVFTGSAMIFLISLLSIRWIGESRPTRLLLIGLFWAVLTAVFEIVLGRFVLSLNWERILSDYDLFSGGFMLPGLVFTALSPLLAGKLRSRFD